MIEEEWDALPQVKMGEAGALLIFEFLTVRGVQCYKPAFPGPHKIDWMGFATKPFLGYIGPLGIEAKTKRHRDNWPDTGPETYHYKRYREVSETMPVLMCFCDTAQRYIYGNYLHILDKPRRAMAFVSKWMEYKNISLPFDYPTEGEFHCWHLADMVPFRKLTGAECINIERFETRSEVYQKKEKWFYPFSNPGLLE
jgi:hypothetical protein